MNNRSSLDHPQHLRSINKVNRGQLRFITLLNSRVGKNESVYLIILTPNDEAIQFRERTKGRMDRNAIETSMFTINKIDEAIATKTELVGSVGLKVLWKQWVAHVLTDVFDSLGENPGSLGMPTIEAIERLLGTTIDMIYCSIDLLLNNRQAVAATTSIFLRMIAVVTIITNQAPGVMKTIAANPHEPEGIGQVKITIGAISKSGQVDTAIDARTNYPLRQHRSCLRQHRAQVLLLSSSCLF